MLRVAGDQDVRTTGKRCAEEMIVVRISASSGQIGGIDMDDVGTRDLQVRERNAHLVSR